MSIVTYKATLDNTVCGIALRDTKGRVFFADDHGSAWIELFNQDIPRLQLHGHIDLAEAQRIADGNVFDWIEHRNTEHARVAA